MGAPERITFFDLAKGIAILLIIVGHNRIPPYLTSWIYSFHVPVFLIISGYFYKERSFKEILKKGFFQLLLPMIVTIGITSLGLAVMFLKSGKWQGPDILEWISEVFLMRGIGHVKGMWFLGALFWGKIWMSLVSGLSIKVKIIYVMILFCIGYFLYMEVSDIPFYADRGMSVPLFLLVGIMLRAYQDLSRQPSLLEVIVSLILLSLGCFFHVNVSGFEYPLGVFSIIISVVISMSFLILIKYISLKSNQNLLIRILTFCGTNSLLMLCIHSLIHTWQFNKFFTWLPDGCFAIMECIFIICVVRVLLKNEFVDRLFHGKLRAQNEN